MPWADHRSERQHAPSIAAGALGRELVAMLMQSGNAAEVDHWRGVAPIWLNGRDGELLQSGNWLVQPRVIHLSVGKSRGRTFVASLSRHTIGLAKNPNGAQGDMKAQILGFLAVGLLAGAQDSAAAVVAFTNESTFVAQTGSAKYLLPVQYLVPSVTVPGQFSLTQVNVPNSLGGLIRTDTYPTIFSLDAEPNAVIGGAENFDIDTLTSLYAVGFTIYEPTGTATLNGCGRSNGCVDSTFTATLYSGTTQLASFTLQPTNDAFSSYGFWSSDPITRITMRELQQGGAENDNEFFGRFFTGTRAAPPTAVPAPVPLPAAVWLLLSGLGGLGLLRRRRAA